MMLIYISLYEKVTYTQSDFETIETDIIYVGTNEIDAKISISHLPRYDTSIQVWENGRLIETL